MLFTGRKDAIEQTGNLVAANWARGNAAVISPSGTTVLMHEIKRSRNVRDLLYQYYIPDLANNHQPITITDQLGSLVIVQEQLVNAAGQPGKIDGHDAIVSQTGENLGSHQPSVAGIYP